MSPVEKIKKWRPANLTVIQREIKPIKSKGPIVIFLTGSLLLKISVNLSNKFWLRITQYTQIIVIINAIIDSPSNLHEKRESNSIMNKFSII